MLTTGEFIDATRAREIGLINRIAAPEDLEQATAALTQSLAAKLPAALRLGKAAFAAQSGLPTAAAYAKAGAVMVDNILLDATNEGIAAFLEKRPAKT